MENKIQGIILKKIPYAELNSIVSVFTKTEGLQTYFISKKQNKPHPEGSLLHFLSTKHAKQQIPRMQEIEWDYMYKRNFTQVRHHCVLSFCVDLLRQSIHFSEPHKDLYEFTSALFIHLDTLPHNELTHIPIFFSLHILTLLGFHLSAAELQKAPLDPLITQNIGYYTQLHTLSSITLNGIQRTQLLAYIIQHYLEYVAEFKYPKSINVIKDILH